MDIILDRPGKADWKKCARLYARAFPRDERAPFFLLRRRAEQERGEMDIIREGERFLGFLYRIRQGNLSYLFYFALEESARGQGIGSKALSLLRQPGQRLLLAREALDPQAENTRQRVRRREFYLKNGFLDLPWGIREAGVTYDAMGWGGEIAPKEYGALMASWAGPVLSKLIPMQGFEQERNTDQSCR